MISLLEEVFRKKSMTTQFSRENTRRFGASLRQNLNSQEEALTDETTDSGLTVQATSESGSVISDNSSVNFTHQRDALKHRAGH